MHAWNIAPRLNDRLIQQWHLVFNLCSQWGFTPNAGKDVLLGASVALIACIDCMQAGTHASFNESRFHLVFCSTQVAPLSAPRLLPNLGAALLPVPLVPLLVLLCLWQALLPWSQELPALLARSLPPRMCCVARWSCLLVSSAAPVAAHQVSRGFIKLELPKGMFSCLYRMLSTHV